MALLSSDKRADMISAKFSLFGLRKLNAVSSCLISLVKAGLTLTKTFTLSSGARLVRSLRCHELSGKLGWRL